MINVLDNKVLGPMILEKIEQGRIEGRREVRQEFLWDLLTLPFWVASRITEASEEDLKRWTKRILSATTLEKTLA